MEILIDIFKLWVRSESNWWSLMDGTKFSCWSTLMRNLRLLFEMQIVCKCGNEEILIVRGWPVCIDTELIWVAELDLWDCYLVGILSTMCLIYLPRLLTRQGWSLPVSPSTGLFIGPSTGTSQRPELSWWEVLLYVKYSLNVCPSNNTGDDCSYQNTECFRD